jgi:hypothetical protein
MIRALELRVTRTKWSLLSMVAVAAGCCLFGGPSDPVVELREFVGTVDDPLRAERMLAQVDRFEQVIRDFDAAAARLGVEMRSANRDHDASRARFDDLFARHDALRETARRQLLDSAISLRGLATADEWETIADLELRAYEERSRVVARAESEEQ